MIDRHARRAVRPFIDIAVLALAWSVLSLAVGIPARPDALFTDWHIGLSLEVAIGLGLLAAWRALGLPRNRVWIALFTAAVVLTATIQLADMTARAVVARPLNIVLDITLIPALFDVMQTTLGGWRATGAIIAIIALIVLSAFLVYKLLHLTDRRMGNPAARVGAGVIVLVAAGLTAGQHSAGALIAGYHPMNTGGMRAWEIQIDKFAENQRRRAAFLQAATEDPLNGWRPGNGSTPPEASLFDRLNGADVLLIYIESYGRSAVEDPLYADTVRPVLERLDARFTDAGLSSRSGWMTAPMVGGQSWLAHATMLSGLWINDQAFFHLFVAEPRLTLVDMFNRAGYRTAAYMPAITLPWPEGRRYDFDRIYEVRDMDYAGPKWYWGTIPDQWVLDFLERGERQRPAEGDRAPLFVKAALISSHAPWLPTPEVVPWETLGDGEIYDQWAGQGDPPHVVWRDQDRIQQKYRESVAYSIEAVGDYVANFADDETLVIFLGDHQPATLITGLDAGFDVPVHVVSGDRNLVDAFADLDFRPGLIPAADATPHRMDIFRNWMVQAYSSLPESVEDGLVSETEAESTAPAISPDS
ncbi:sulfatase-like hydrolase/transferase [Fodinicurvata sp. EGI_FJ10296]|uniref:sulfatase-like hydrolase/transferase n=1 Tax=Fodinicurvata sp. EGI_FJ10296 TaxID=3231908 RepID=UPI0034571193